MAEAKTISFGDDGNVDPEVHEGPKRKPLVPFHGQVEDKYLTNKQKRVMKRRAKNDSVVGGQAEKEQRTAHQIQKRKGEIEKNKVRQTPQKRKEKAKAAKDRRRAMHEERQM